MNIGIAIVHYGDFSHLEKCLKSLKVIDTEIGHAKAFFERTKESDNLTYTLTHLDGFVIKIYDCNQNNIGFSKANNKLIKQFLNIDDIEWIWLLNNDTEVPELTLTQIKNQLDGYDTYQEGVGVIGFQIRSINDPDFIHQELLIVILLDSIKVEV